MLYNNNLKLPKSKIALLLIALLSTVLISCKMESSIISNRGVIPNSNWGTSNKNVTLLKGDIIFYPGRFITEEDIISGKIEQFEKRIIPIRVAWNKIEKPYPRAFFGSYRLTINHPNKDKTFSLYLAPPSSSCTIFVNGKKAGSIGKPSIEVKNSIERFHSLTIDLERDALKSDLIFHVSNRDYIQGGMDAPIYIGSQAGIKNYEKRQSNYASFLIGTLFTLFLYLFIVFLNNKENRYLLYLALFSLTVILNTLVMNFFVIINYFPDIPAKWLMKIGIPNFALSAIFLILFISQMLKKSIKFPILVKILVIIYIAFFILLLTIPAHLINLLFPALEVISVISAIYVTILYVKAIRLKQYKRWTHLITWLALSSSMLFDIINGMFFHNNEVITSIFPAGIIVFIIGHTQILASQHGHIQKKLAEISVNFESELLKRTRELQRINNTLQNKASRDSLTGLFNRSRLQQIEKSKNSIFSDITILFIDLDNFKSINDTWGHNAGDVIIKEFAELIRKVARPTDIPIRLGGDEFIIILPQTDSEGASQLAERIQKQLKSQIGFKAALAEVLTESELENYARKLTCSIGISERSDKEPIEEIIENADKALFNAKENGKNGYVVYK